MSVATNGKLNSVVVKSVDNKHYVANAFNVEPVEELIATDYQCAENRTSKDLH